MTPINDLNRRPLKVRNANFSKKIAARLSQKNITPNQISIASIFFAALAAACLFIFQDVTFAWEWILPVLAACFIQRRLLCNLFDGMVAVEGGKQTPSDELFNDIPDRVADPLILVAAGYATGYAWGITMGWFSGLIAVMTAYIRVLCAGIGAPMDFSGPMAKQHRMALMTAGCILTAFEHSLWTPGRVLAVVLLALCAGGMITVFRRVMSAYNYLDKKS